MNEHNPMPLKDRLQADMKTALKAGDKARLGAIRLIIAALKQREIDERVVLDDSGVHAVLDKMIKQRRDSIGQYEAAGREDLAAQERFELEVCQQYLPAALDAADIDALITAAIQQTAAVSMKDMGKVMAHLKPAMQGRADLGAVSALVKERLGG